MRHSSVGSVMPFLVGAGLGVAAGLFLAPKSGKKLRGDVARSVNDGVEQFTVSGKKLNQRLGKVVAQAQEQIHEAVEAGESAFYEAKNS